MTRFNVYLAGPISKNDWRTQLYQTDVDPVQVDDLFIHKRNVERLWMPRSAVGFDDVFIVGPYFVGCDHGCTHGRAVDHAVGTHATFATYDIGGCEGLDSMGEEVARREITRRCLTAIRSADLVYAWIDKPDAHGTFVEIGYALGAGISVVIDGPPLHCCDRPDWFVHHMQDKVRYGPKINPAFGFATSVNHMRAQRARS